MDALNLPTYSFKIKQEGKRKWIFDQIRKKYVLLTPEEWVRQHVIRFLTEEKKYPAGLVAIEMELEINRLLRRPDIVLFNQNGHPVLIVECKSPKVKISQMTFDQIARYNLSLNVEYLIVTNGLTHFCCKLNRKDNSYIFLKDIPDYEDMKETIY